MARVEKLVATGRAWVLLWKLQQKKHQSWICPTEAIPLDRVGCPPPPSPHRNMMLSLTESPRGDWIRLGSLPPKKVSTGFLSGIYNSSFQTSNLLVHIVGPIFLRGRFFFFAKIRNLTQWYTFENDSSCRLAWFYFSPIVSRKGARQSKNYRAYA